MKSFLVAISLIGLTGSSLLVGGCGGGKKPSSDPDVAAPQAIEHHHHPPHGGTPVVLGNELYHLELVRDAAAGKLQAFVLDGEMENFVRCSPATFEVTATVASEKRPLVFRAIADPATGEKVGDTALFEAQAEWLKTISRFDGVLTSLAIQGSTFANVSFNFPSGNDRD